MNFPHRLSPTSTYFFFFGSSFCSFCSYFAARSIVFYHRSLFLLHFTQFKHISTIAFLILFCSFLASERYEFDSPSNRYAIGHTQFQPSCSVCLHMRFSHLSIEEEVGKKEMSAFAQQSCLSGNTSTKDRTTDDSTLCFFFSLLLLFSIKSLTMILVIYERMTGLPG